MGEAFMPRGGGGAALNFKVLAYATEEALLTATPANNTIGIITETPITSWIFSATEPSPAEAGMVWITVNTYSSVKFNALKKNGIQVYPIVTVREVIAFLHNNPVDGKVYIDDEMKAKMEAYLEQYGAKN